LRALAEVHMISHVPTQRPAVDAAVVFIAEHYADRLTVAGIAAAARLSEHRLAHVFPTTTGLSVKDYVTRFRVAVAERLLFETSETLEAIPCRIGCADVSTLHRTFRDVHGASPGEYRRSLRSLTSRSA
jgi:transcriptional regulator GlxA family with amidase domain